MTDKTQIYIIEHGADIIVKEKEGQNKMGIPKQQRISKFHKPENAIRYLKQKFGIIIEQ